MFFVCIISEGSTPDTGVIARNTEMSSLAEDTAALWEQRIRNNHSFLVDSLLRDLPSVIDCMIPEVFTPDDLDYVQRGDPDGTRLACNRRFLKRLLEKGTH